MSPREPYEKPTVERLDDAYELANQLDRLIVRAKRELEDIAIVQESLATRAGAMMTACDNLDTFIKESRGVLAALSVMKPFGPDIPPRVTPGPPVNDDPLYE